MKSLKEFIEEGKAPPALAGNKGDFGPPPPTADSKKSVSAAQLIYDRKKTRSPSLPPPLPPPALAGNKDDFGSPSEKIDAKSISAAQLIYNRKKARSPLSPPPLPPPAKA